MLERVLGYIRGALRYLGLVANVQHADAAVNGQVQVPGDVGEALLNGAAGNWGVVLVDVHPKPSWLYRHGQDRIPMVLSLGGLCCELAALVMEFAASNGENTLEHIRRSVYMSAIVLQVTCIMQSAALLYMLRTRSPNEDQAPTEAQAPVRFLIRRPLSVSALYAFGGDEEACNLYYGPTFYCRDRDIFNIIGGEQDAAQLLVEGLASGAIEVCQDTRPPLLVRLLVAPLAALIIPTGLAACVMIQFLGKNNAPSIERGVGAEVHGASFDWLPMVVPTLSIMGSIATSAATWIKLIADKMHAVHPEPFTRYDITINPHLVAAAHNALGLDAPHNIILDAAANTLPLNEARDLVMA
jgi:hypothetical protein